MHIAYESLSARKGIKYTEQRRQNYCIVGHPRFGIDL